MGNSCADLPPHRPRCPQGWALCLQSGVKRRLLPQGAPRSMEVGATCVLGIKASGLGGDRWLGCGVPSAPRVPGAAQGGWVSEEGKAPGHRGPLRPVWSAEAGPPARVGQGQVWTCSGHELWPSCSPEALSRVTCVGGHDSVLPAPERGPEDALHRTHFWALGYSPLTTSRGHCVLSAPIPELKFHFLH